METSDIDPMAKWRDLVAGFILAFREIELWSFRLWRNHVSSDPAPHNFKDRTGQVLSALRRLGSYYIHVVSVLEQSLKLADKRNTIAHSQCGFRYGSTARRERSVRAGSYVGDDRRLQTTLNSLS
jgi:hypothetical protein